MVYGPKTEMTFQERELTEDSQGGHTESWTARRKIKGVLVPLKGSERMITGKQEVFATHKFFIDYPTGITIEENDRFILGDRTFDIQFVGDPGEQHRHLEIEMEEIT
jgi:SPP1 family predicted phage head-tail adaptor